MSNEREIIEIQNGLMKTIITVYEPEVSRWNRNYSHKAEWYFLWRKELND